MRVRHEYTSTCREMRIELCIEMQYSSRLKKTNKPTCSPNGRLLGRSHRATQATPRATQHPDSLLVGECCESCGSGDHSVCDWSASVCHNLISGQISRALRQAYGKESNVDNNGEKYDLINLK